MDLTPWLIFKSYCVISSCHVYHTHSCVPHHLGYDLQYDSVLVFFLMQGQLTYFFCLPFSQHRHTNIYSMPRQECLNLRNAMS